MSSVTDNDNPVEQTTTLQRIAVLAIVTMAVTLYSLSILVVSVLLPQMQGSLSVTRDEISWVITFNILATAVMTPMAGWFDARFGRRNVMLFCTAGTTLATLGCGLSDSLLEMVLYRIAQGAFGAPLVPLGQAIILDTFPRSQHGRATSIFGMGVVVGPVIGPTLGGYLAELYTWRWAFYMIMPLGIVAFLGLYAFLREKRTRARTRLDWTGFLALSAAVVSLQLMLSRGQRLDWFDSPEIIIEAFCAVVGFYIFLTHSIMARQPFLNLRLLADRNYALGLLIVLLYGMLNFTPMVLMPPMLQNILGYPDSIIGFVLGMRGVGAVSGFFAAMWLSKLDPRVGMGLGYLLLGLSGLYMSNFDINVTTFDVAFNSVLQGFSIGIIWVPLTVVTFATIDSKYLAEGSAVFHLLRNLGSSIYISLSVTLAITSTQISYAEMTEFITEFNKTLQFPWSLGAWRADDITGLASVSGEINRQAAMIGYINAFRAFAFTSFAVLPLVLLVKIKR